MSDMTVEKWEMPTLFGGQLAGSHKGSAALGTSSDSSRNEFESGREAGFEKGVKEGLAAAGKEIQGKIITLNALIESMNKPLADMDTQVAKELIQLSVKLAEAIIHREVELDPELLEKQVGEVLATLTSESDGLKIRFNPEDAKMLRDGSIPSGDDDSIQKKNGFVYEIVEDPSINRGGCILQTPHTTIDATIEKQLKDILTDMLEKASE